ncbi:PA3496 family putative envelope integrity protein [Pontibacter sp. JAM-7]|uniref:PA3496 family putative envelope integrity protein n=1 Tax=Pontibacter sp. JAM-7 TaxID=3366581 RepID=UPI003AF8FCDC
MKQRNTPKTDSLIDMDDWVGDPSTEENLDNVIYKRASLHPDKRRRLEALLEEKRLMRELTDVFDEEDSDWEH